MGWLANPGENLGRRTANAGVWAFVLSMTIRAITLIRTGVLANLLAPQDFGLMGIAMLVIGFVTNFTQTGFRSALIQNKSGLQKSYLDTAWTVELIRGVLLALAMLAAAPLVGSFFASPSASQLTSLLALGLAITGFSNIGVVSFDKDLEFQKRFVFRSTPHVVDLAVSIVLGIMWGNAWALAWGWVAGRTASTVASYVAHPYRPRLAFDRHAARSMFSFGIWALASQILLWFTLNIDDVVVGRIVGATALGFYQMAYTMSQLTTTEITSVVNQVAFPAYSKLQDMPERLGRAYAKTVQLVALASFPTAAGLWFVGPVAVETFLSEKWLPMLPVFNILLIWGLIRSLLATTGPLFQGVGRPSLATKIQTAQFVILAAIVVPITLKWGVVGAAWATVGAAVVPDTIAIILAAKIATSRTRSIAKVLTVPAINSALMLIVLILLRDNGVLPLGWPLLVWGPVIGMIVYGIGTLTARRWAGYLEGGLLPAGISSS